MLSMMPVMSAIDADERAMPPIIKPTSDIATPPVFAISLLETARCVACVEESAEAVIDVPAAPLLERLEMVTGTVTTTP